ncbi:hypothetical protein Ancab_017778 [Ancistrocladus abbreviatus]
MDPPELPSNVQVRDSHVIVIFQRKGRRSGLLFAVPLHLVGVLSLAFSDYYDKGGEIRTSGLQDKSSSSLIQLLLILLLLPNVTGAEDWLAVQDDPLEVNLQALMLKLP